MRIRDLLIFIIGTAVGTAVGGAAVFHPTTPREVVVPQVVAGPQTVRLLVARTALKYGTTIEPGHLQWVEWPSNAVPPGAFTSADELLGAEDGQFRTVLRTIEPGEPILDSNISKLGSSPQILKNLEPDMRAVSIRIDATTGVSRFISAGDRVDILLTRTQRGQLTSTVILQDITVIATDENSNSGAPSPQPERMVTVAVDTIQAQNLALAQQVGRLSLTLRGIGQGNDDAHPLPPDPGAQPPVQRFLPPVIRKPRDADEILPEFPREFQRL